MNHSGRIEMQGESSYCATGGIGSASTLKWQDWQSVADFKHKLGRKKEEAIVALLSSRSIEDVARACNTPVRTLYRWLADSDFNEVYRAARRKAYSQSVARLQQASTAAATTLLKVMVDPSTPASTRVRAAEHTLTHAAKAIEIEDIEARLSALEMATPEENRRRIRAAVIHTASASPSEVRQRILASLNDGNEHAARRHSAGWVRLTSTQLRERIFEHLSAQ